MNRCPPPPTHTNPAEPTKRIAVAIDLDHSVSWHHDCCEGILHYGRKRGWSCSIDPLFMDHAPAGHPGGYDGVVGRIDEQIAEAARARGIPAVNHWSHTPAKEVPSIVVDSRVGGQMIGEHLVACGYRHLGCLDVQANAAHPDWEAGLSQVAADAGLEPPAVCFLEMDHAVAGNRETFSRFLKEIDRWLTGLKTPVGLYVGVTSIARYVAQRCKRLGLAVPEDVGIVAWDDDATATAISPSLSIIDHDWFELGYQAAAMLDELMRGKASYPLHRLVTPDRLIQRDSTDVFLCEDALVKQAMQYIAEHCRQEVKVVEVADALNVSDRTLYRRFDEALGRPIKDEIKRLRAERLKVMVEETQMPLKEIAEMYGFSTPTQFTRYFRQAAGMTPSAYRKKFGEQVEG